MNIRAAERFIRGRLREQFGPRYRDKFKIRTNAGNRAVSVHWMGAPHESVIEAIGKPLVTGIGGDGLWFFQTHHNE